MKKVIRVLFYAISIICMVVLVFGTIYAINKMTQQEHYAETYCSSFGMELVAYGVNDAEAWVLCRSETAQLTTIWK